MLRVFAITAEIRSRSGIDRVEGALVGGYLMVVVMGNGHRGAAVVLKDRSTRHHLHTEMRTRSSVVVRIRVVIVVIMMIVAMMLVARVVVMVVVMGAVHLGRLPFEEVSHLLDEIGIRGDMEVNQWLHHLLAVIRFGHLH